MPKIALLNLLDLAWLNWFLYFRGIEKENFYQEVLNQQALRRRCLLYEKCVDCRPACHISE